MAVALNSQPLVLYLPPLGSAPVRVVCIKESHTLPVTFTKNPVEQGSPVTDHARPEPRAVTLEIMVSNTPLITDGYEDAAALWQRLVSLQGTPALIEVLTNGGQYFNMGVDSVSRSIDAKTANAVAGTLTMHEIRIVKNKLTRIVVARPQAQPSRKAGAVTVFTLAETDSEPQSLANQGTAYGAAQLKGSNNPVLAGFGDFLSQVEAGPK